MDDGFLIRSLPDGGSEFVLTEPRLSAVTVDDRVRLVFGEAEVVIGADFTVEGAGSLHRVFPGRPETLVPVLSLYPGTARWLWTSVDGELVAVFTGGSTLTVRPSPEVEAWSIGSVHCLPSGLR